MFTISSYENHIKILLDNIKYIEFRGDKNFLSDFLPDNIILEEIISHCNKGIYHRATSEGLLTAKKHILEYSLSLQSQSNSEDIYYSLSFKEEGSEYIFNFSSLYNSYRSSLLGYLYFKKKPHGINYSEEYIFI